MSILITISVAKVKKTNNSQYYFYLTSKLKLNEKSEKKNIKAS